MPRIQSIAQSSLLALSDDADPRLVAAFARLPGVDVVGNAPDSAMVLSGQAFPVEAQVVESEEIGALLSSLDRRPSRRRRVVAINAVLDDAAAARLEDAEIGFVDAAGRSWLPGQELTKQVEARLPAYQRSLRPGSLRPAQFIADYPDEPWTIRRLAERAGSSEVTAHRLLTTLEAAGLIERRGRGRRTERRVTDAGGVRHWLARNARPRTPERLSCFVRDSEKLPAEAAGYPLALTGAAAADRMGWPVLTGVSRPLYRVEASGKELEEIPRALGGFRTERGANLVLLADPERLATGDARSIGNDVLAPPSRIMLDLYLEPRGEAAVDVFLDLWGSERTS